MHILILNWRDIWHPLSGGAEQSLMEHAKFWQKKGAQITWFTSLYPQAKQDETVDGVRFIRKGSHYSVHANANIYYKKHLKNSVDIVIDNFHGLPFFTPLYIERKKIIALINEPAKEVWFKNMIWPFNALAFYAEPYFFTVYKEIPFITSANSIAKELQKLGIPKKNIYNIPHGVTLEQLDLDVDKEKKPTVIFLAQLSPDKGIEDALKAFSKIKAAIPKAAFWIVGKAISEKFERKLHDLVQQLDIVDSVEFFGFVPQREKFRLLQKAWVLVHPSTREGWGLNVIEANSCGTPVIGYNITGLKDSIKNGETGLLTKENTPNDLAKTTLKLLKDKQQYQIFSKNAVKWSTQFTWEVAGEKSWELINKIYEKSKE